MREIRAFGRVHMVDLVDGQLEVSWRMQPVSP